ncbi:DUF370 domain-containing protein [Leptotrichia sp. OH3620_COT-345]|uniref:DUF370 domain-containing protein n=1 Tax=Leptotrichia sp. OH3620_COT-345 TaxID=2491048 RepID=UPI000F64F93D|nr:DUF370 domain-containing protein [Leptotrichia sp. OH3620_COT-345]RRD40728.1 DUF370 domain-containing protein [Leptotrichia sp. OH3620_COT-345]
MYLYIENNIYINLNEIELLIDYNDFILKNDIIKTAGKRKILNLSAEKKEKRTIIFTKRFVYITSYTNRALKMRADEYDNLVNSVLF